MTITKIEKQKNSQKRYSIYMDGEFKFGLAEQDLLYFKFKEGTDITLERYNYIMEYILYTKAKDKAYRYLGYKARTEKELTDKLIEQQYPQEIITRIIEQFKDYGYINDQSYVVSHINNRVKYKPMAKKMLKYELIQKGVARDIIDDTVENFNINELNMAIELLQKKVKAKTQMDEKEIKRAYNYLLRRGFDYDTVNKAFKKVLDQEHEKN
jgi:regulatory protein